MSKDDAGEDVKFDSKGAYVEVTDARMYYLVQSPKFTAHLISLEPEGSGLTLHSFTFGNNCQLQDRPWRDRSLLSLFVKRCPASRQSESSSARCFGNLLLETR